MKIETHDLMLSQSHFFKKISFFFKQTVDVMSCNCADLEWHARFKSTDLKGVFAKNENQFNFKQTIQILQYFIIFFN